jgi:hypothetical protein
MTTDDDESTLYYRLRMRMVTPMSGRVIISDSVHQVPTPEAMDDLVEQLKANAGWQTSQLYLLGQGAPRYRVLTRRFHTQEQADSYTRGYDGHMTENASMDDFSVMGYLDADDRRSYGPRGAEGVDHD